MPSGSFGRSQVLGNLPGQLACWIRRVPMLQFGHVSQFRGNRPTKAGWPSGAAGAGWKGPQLLGDLPGQLVLRKVQPSQVGQVEQLTGDAAAPSNR